MAVAWEPVDETLEAHAELVRKVATVGADETRGRVARAVEEMIPHAGAQTRDSGE